MALVSPLGYSRAAVPYHQGVPNMRAAWHAARAHPASRRMVLERSMPPGRFLSDALVNELAALRVEAAPEDRRTGDVFREVEPEDLLRFGLIPEFIGRVPVLAQACWPWLARWSSQWVGRLPPACHHPPASYSSTSFSAMLRMVLSFAMPRAR